MLENSYNANRQLRIDDGNKKKRNRSGGGGGGGGRLDPQQQELQYGVPFLYRPVGHIGFSPNPRIWKDFLEFAKCALSPTKNLTTATSDIMNWYWYNAHDKRSMWTQLFTYYCKQHNLYTLYVIPKATSISSPTFVKQTNNTVSNRYPPQSTSLATHWRKPGTHFSVDMGQEHYLATIEDIETIDTTTTTTTASSSRRQEARRASKFFYPKDLVRIDWNGEPVVVDDEVSTSTVSSSPGASQGPSATTTVLRTLLLSVVEPHDLYNNSDTLDRFVRNVRKNYYNQTFRRSGGGGGGGGGEDTDTDSGDSRRDVMLLLPPSTSDEIKDIFNRHNIQYVIGMRSPTTTASEKEAATAAAATTTTTIDTRWSFFRDMCRENGVYDYCIICSIQECNTIFQDDDEKEDTTTTTTTTITSTTTKHPFKYINLLPSPNKRMLLHLFEYNYLMKEEYLQQAKVCFHQQSPSLSNKRRRRKQLQQQQQEQQKQLNRYIKSMTNNPVINPNLFIATPTVIPKLYYLVVDNVPNKEECLQEDNSNGNNNHEIVIWNGIIYRGKYLSEQDVTIITHPHQHELSCFASTHSVSGDNDHRKGKPTRLPYYHPSRTYYY